MLSRISADSRHEFECRNSSFCISIINKYVIVNYPAMTLQLILLLANIAEKAAVKPIAEREECTDRVIQENLCSNSKDAEQLKPQIRLS
jgi:hypothetical protein